MVTDFEKETTCQILTKLSGKDNFIKTVNSEAF